MSLEEFDYDDDGEETVIFYIMGIKPIMVECIDSFPVFATALDFKTKEFAPYPELMRDINDSVEIVKVDEIEFRNACLALGAKPPLQSETGGIIHPAR